MKPVVTKMLVLLAMLLALTAVCWSTTGARAVGTTTLGLGDDPNEPAGPVDPNDPNVPEMTSAMIWLADAPADPNDPNDPNVPERARVTVRRA